MNPLIQLKAIPAILVALACFAVSPGSKAVNPLPDGGYPGNNTAEGTRALFNLTTGTNNTASGFEALFKNTTGFRNTAVSLSNVSPRFEIARVLVRFDHIARVIVNANCGIICTAAKLRIDGVCDSSHAHRENLSPRNRTHQPPPFVQTPAKAQLAGCVETQPSVYLTTLSPFRVLCIPIMAA